MKPIALAAIAAAFLASMGTAQADSGWYAGGSIGSATLELDLDDGSPTPPIFDENDFGWKILVGYNFELAIIDLGIEGGYVDFGAPSADIFGESAEIDATAFDIFGVAGVDLGPVGVFAKLGYVAWDADFSLGPFSDSDDGSDIAYGVGARFNLGSLEIRGEYELFDIEDSEDVSLWSAGLVWHFN